jgi:hypothetical protein
VGWHKNCRLDGSNRRRSRDIDMKTVYTVFVLTVLRFYRLTFNTKRSFFEFKIEQKIVKTKYEMLVQLRQLETAQPTNNNNK